MLLPSTLGTALVGMAHQFVMLQILLLLATTHYSVASPVTNSAAANKPFKTPSNSINTNSGQSPVHHQPVRSSAQDAHLNSLNAYATSYDSLSSNNAPNSNFKPSYKLPDMETNFKPIQSAAINEALPPALANPTPVLMQYIPQSISDSSMQYLQLIPTRPLIVPISPYLTSGPVTPPQQLPPAYHQLMSSGNVITDYAPRPGPLLSAVVPDNMVSVGPSQLHDISFGPPAYSNPVGPYRGNFRFNREIKEKNTPLDISLNLNEYIPGPHKAAHNIYSIRGRP